MGVYTGIAMDNVRINSGTMSNVTMTNIVSNAPVTKTANFTVAATENFIVCNGAASITVTLPAASTNIGRVLVIKTIAAQTVVSAASNVLPVTSATAGTAILAGTAGAWAMLVSNGTNWVIMAS
jgi:hypothetical protein